MKRAMQKMMGMTCEDVERFLLAYLDGELPWATRVLFRMHIAFCTECKAYIRKYKVARELGQRVMRGDGDDHEDIPEDLIAAIVKARREPVGD